MNGSTVTLMDINKERLETIYRFAKKYSSEVKSNINFQKTMDRKEAIKDSDFVINVAMAGSHEYYEKMRAISEKYGYFRGINSVEWNMVSDYHTIWGYYQFKLAQDIAFDVEALSPDAWLLQVANPVLELTTLIGRTTKVKVIGLCDGYYTGRRDIAKALGLNEKEITFVAIGLNHDIWVTEFKKGNEDLYPLFREWIDKEYPSFYKTWYEEVKSNPLAVHVSPVMVDMYKTYGLIPVGDTVRNGTWKYHRDLETKKKWYGPLGGFDSPEGWKFYLDREKKEAEKIKNVVEDPNIRVSSLFPSEPIGLDPVVPVINAIANDKKSIIQVNVLNNGAIDGIPNDVAVEIPAVVDAKGVHIDKSYKLPTKILNFAIRPRIVRMEWALEAFLEGGKEILFEWLVDDPRTKNDQQVEEVINALLSMEENKEMAKHFRG